jgi:hypothetical protein
MAMNNSYKIFEEILKKRGLVEPADRDVFLNPD